jgi:membrane associated rhomboid family serine protease
MMGGNPTTPLGFPRPGKGLKAVLLGLLTIWLIYALAMNWAGVAGASFLALCGNTELILAGQVWRLFTASFLHMPSGTVFHILSVLIGLFFLAPSLEAEWGTKRFLRFLFLTGVLAYTTQFLVSWALPARIAMRLAPDYYFGAMPTVEAVAIAWALSFKGRTVNLFFVLPVSSRGLILFVIGMSVMYLIAGATPPSGHVAPFAGMVFGWLLGGGTPSPLRRLYLKFRLSRLEQEVRRDRNTRKKRAQASGLRVIDGGRDEGKGGGGGRMLH